MITIIDYGCGNINAFVNVFKRLNLESHIARRPSDLIKSKKIILPGVGSFDHVMNQFNFSGLRKKVEKKIMEEGVPVLGICAGMQILANGSEEGTEPGLGWIPGFVKKFNEKDIPFKTKFPHMGWNEIIHNGNPLFQDIEPTARFYFVHSYYFDCETENNSIATTEYGGIFSSAVNNGNIYGVQFHPEKSHHNGHQLLKNFANL